MSSEIELPDALHRLYSLLPRDGKDADIPAIYSALFPGQRATNFQQALGPYVSRLNRKLKPHGWRVAPGIARRSYRLVEL